MQVLSTLCKIGKSANVLLGNGQHYPIILYLYSVNPCQYEKDTNLGPTVEEISS